MGLKIVLKKAARNSEYLFKKVLQLKDTKSNPIVSFIIRFFPVSHWLFFKYLQSFILCFSYILLFSKLSSTNNSIY